MLKYEEVIVCKYNRKVMIAVTLNNNHQLYLVVQNENNYGFSQNILKATKFLEDEAKKILNSLISLNNKNLKYKLIKIC